MTRTFFAAAVAISLGCPTWAFAQQRTDVTNDVVDHMKRHFVGYSADREKTTIDENRAWKDRAYGSATVKEFVKHEGKIERIQIDDLVVYKGDITMTFRYTGETGCDRVERAGGNVVDHPWGNIHPQGVIRIHLRFSTNLEFKGEAETAADHRDRPGRFVQEYIAQARLVPRAKTLLNERLGVRIP